MRSLAIIALLIVAVQSLFLKSQLDSMQNSASWNNYRKIAMRARSAIYKKKSIEEVEAMVDQLYNDYAFEKGHYLDPEDFGIMLENTCGDLDIYEWAMSLAFHKLDLNDDQYIGRHEMKEWFNAIWRYR